MTRYVKDPDAALDYASDWTAWLDTDETITSHTVTVDTGLTKASDTATDTKVTAWLSGGEVGSDYRVTFHIETSQGREDDRTVTIRVRER